MASRVPDQTEDGQGGEAPADRGRPTMPGRRSESGKSDDKKSESEKAETDIAAGDVADDLADFA